jgi:hypothetical protein
MQAHQDGRNPVQKQCHGGKEILLADSTLRRSASRPAFSELRHEPLCSIFVVGRCGLGDYRAFHVLAKARPVTLRSTGGGYPLSSAITATNAGLIPLDDVTISVGLNLICTKGISPGCDPPLFPDPNRYKSNHFTLALKALGKRNLGIGEKLSFPIYPAISIGAPDPNVYVDMAIVIDYEVPVIHWKRHMVYPIYTGRFGEWLWG